MAVNLTQSRAYSDSSRGHRAHGNRVKNLALGEKTKKQKQTLATIKRLRCQMYILVTKSEGASSAYKPSSGMATAAL